MSGSQLFRALSRDEEAALRASIERFGVLVPVLYDADGNLIDGHHRERLAGELGKPVPTMTLDLKGEEAEAAARDLNLARRHLDNAERRGYVIQRATSERPPSKRQMARELGVNKRTVGRDIESIGADAPMPKRVHTSDGRTYPARRTPRPEPEQEPEAATLFEPELPEGFEVLCRDARDFYPNEGPADVAFTSPPYNVGLEYHGDSSGDALVHDEWLELLATTFQVLVSGWQVARIIVNIPLSIGRNPCRCVIGDVIELLARAGADFDGLVIWDKMQTGNRTSWGSWRSPTAPTLRDRSEALVVASTDNELRATGLVETDGHLYSPLLGPDLFPALTQNLWRVPQDGGRAHHPASFPIALAENVIRLWGWPGCRVIDPFAGSGTTGVAALRLGAVATLIDQSEDYCAIARKRLEAGK